MLSVRYLVLNGRISYDRSRNELRKERDVQRDIQGIFLNSRISAVYVNDIADALKREKRYAYREYDARYGDGDAEAVQYARAEAGILIIPGSPRLNSSDRIRKALFAPRLFDSPTPRPPR